MDKKTLLAVILSVLVVIGYQLYIAKAYPPAETAVTQTIVNKMCTLSDEEVKESSSLLPIDSKGPIVSLLPEKIVEKETEKYIVRLSNVGGCIKSIRLKNGWYAPSSNESDLIEVQDIKNAIFNMEGMGVDSLLKAHFKVEEKANEVIFSHRLTDEMELIKKYTFHNSLYAIEFEVCVQNKGDAQIMTSYSINTAADIAMDSKIDRRYVQAIAEIDGKIKRSNGSKDKGVFIKGDIGYAGLQNKYFSVIAKTNIPSEGVVIKHLEDENILSCIKIAGFAILPRSSLSHKFLLYAGPTDKKIMEQYELGSATSSGLLGGISDILLGALRFFHKISGNWGIAVILLSILVNLVLFPLSRKSHESMKKMQHIQPHMDKLREEHKDNPHKLNKEMMELYKKYDVNPMGGCLPLILQIPIFIALYQALMQSLDLRGAGFLWIKDLSMPDAISLPFSLPLLGNSINMLPILMAIAMIFQQKFASVKQANQSQQQKQQQQMMIIMPIVFLFIMYSFPAGLVLYWLVNTLLTTFEQRAIMHS